MRDTFNKARGLLGKQVIVKLAENVVTKGKLLSFNDWGEIVTVDEMGGVGFSWPMLDIEEDV